MKIRLIIVMLLSMLIQLQMHGQTTAIPDPNFEQALIDLGLDDVLDGQVLTANINTVIALQIPNKNISDLTGIEDFAALTILQCNENQLTSLDLSSNPNLYLLICSKNQLTSLNVSNNTALRELMCNENMLTSLELPSSNTLTKLWCYQNQIENLDVTNHTALFDLSCQQNQLTSLDVSNNTALITLNCSLNQLTSLDVSTNIALTGLFCNTNQLKSLDISNNTEIDILWCFNNNLTSLDVSKNLALTKLLCGNNQLSSLDVTKNALLSVLTCGYNQITSINVSNMPNLEHIEISVNPLGSLDLTNNVSLIEVGCVNSNLTSLKIDNCVSLKTIHCQFNQITSLDVSTCPSLIYLGCYNNQLTSIDVSNNPLLTSLGCFFNKITHLDVSNNIHLDQLGCNNNLLESLNVNNGNNVNFSYFAAGNNPMLTCVKVDDAAWSTANWTNIDPQMYFSENCEGGAYTLIPDNKFEQALIDLGLDDVLDGKVLTGNINSITTLDVRNKNIGDLTGIEDFSLLENLDASDNPLNSLNFSSSTILKNIIVNNCQLTTINVSQIPELRSLGCSHNQLTEIYLNNNLLLEGLGIDHNQLTQLDVSNNPILKGLMAHDNKFTSIDLSLNQMLMSLTLHYNPQLSSLNLKNSNNQLITYFAANNCPNLTCIQVDDAAWSTANWTQIDPQMYFSEFCGSTAGDSDGDGVPDDFDDYPLDALRAFDNHFPAAGYGSLAFEDLWPGMGDYDFNDVVVDYRFKTVTNATNKVVEVIASFVLKASGASLRNGFGFNLPHASANLISQLSEVQVTGYEANSNFISLQSNGFEASQSKPTIIVFDDFFNVLEHPGSGLGINTELNRPFVEFDTLTLLIKPSGTQFTLTDFQFEQWNPFIIVNSERGKEIHLPNHPPTDLADMSLFGTYEDSSNPASGRYYKTVNNLPWAINIVSEFVWPLEKISIVEAYKHFFDWAKSSGADYGDWYENKPGFRVPSNLYTLPQ